MPLYRLQSTPGVYAPGLIRFARQLHRDGHTDRARDLVNAWPGLPASVVESLITGTATTEVTEDEALVVSTDDDSHQAAA